MLTPPESGAFKVVTADNAGESNEKIGELVPATAPTVTADSPNIVRNVLLRQEIVVIEVQDEVLHATISSVVVAVWSLKPRPRPDTVKELPPLTAAFNVTEETIAASKLKTGDDVPAIAATVTVDCPNMVFNEPVMHVVVVDDVQDVVPQGTNSREVVNVTSDTPKSSPTTVTELPPLAGVLNRKTQLEATGESKLNASTSVPATPPTLTVDKSSYVTRGEV